MLDIRKVGKKFGGVKALDDVTFSTKAGEIMGIIGPNGAGKSTLINVISGLYKTDLGEIYYEGENVVNGQPNDLAKKGIVRTFQSTVAYTDTTVERNIIRGHLGNAYTGILGEFIRSKAIWMREGQIFKKTSEILELLKLDKWRDYQVKSLPYGLQKLLGLGIALSCKPKILMLDEPAAGLNEEEKDFLIDLIKKINSQGITIILVEHDMRLVMKLCHQIVVLNYGKVIAIGSPNEIQRNNEVIEAYLGEE